MRWPNHRKDALDEIDFHLPENVAAKLTKRRSRATEEGSRFERH
jgi:hypothetical protein